MAGEGATHYFWNNHTRLVAGLIMAMVPCSVNTYADHPTGWGTDERSIDVWGRYGRGDPLPETRGEALKNYLLSDNSPLQVDWLIWSGWIYYGNGSSEQYWDPTDQHYDHVHVTIL